MNIIIKTKNLELTESLEKFINTKIGKVEKFLDAGAQLFFEIEKETLHHRKGEVFCAEAIIELIGKKIVARAKGFDMGKVIAEVKRELEMEIKKYKAKMVEAPRREAKKSRKEMF